MVYNMKNKLTSFCILSLMGAFTLHAQQNMSLKECMEYALKYSTKKEIQLNHQENLLLQRRDAILQAFTPSVSAGTNAFTNFGRTIDPETNSYISTTSFSNGYFVSAGLSLFDGFSAINRIKIAKVAVRMGLSESQQLDDEICLSVMQAYYNVIFQNQMSEVISEQIATARKNMELITKQYELGQKGYADVAQVEADLAERESQWVDCNNKKESSLLDLKAIMLWPMQDSLVLEVESHLLPALSLSETSSETLNEVVAYAQQYQSTALLAQGRVEQAEYALRNAKGQFLPSLSLQGGWSTSIYTYPGRKDYQAPSFSSQFHNNGGEYVQLSLSIPIYDRLSRQSQLRRKRNELENARIGYRQTLKDIENEVARAVHEREGARSAVLLADRRLKAQEESYRLHVRKFEQGLISPVEYQTVANAWLHARAEWLDARLQYRLKSSVVNFYNGQSYLEQQY